MFQTIFVWISDFFFSGAVSFCRRAALIYFYKKYCKVRGLLGHRDRDRKNHDSQTRDTILPFFLCPEIGQFSPRLKNTERPWRKRQKSTGKIFKIPMEKGISSKLQISVPCLCRTCPDQKMFFLKMAGFSFSFGTPLKLSANL